MSELNGITISYLNNGSKCNINSFSEETINHIANLM